MNLTQLKTLVAIAEAESFSLAADRLFITPSAVSHQMRDLEADLGVALFDRQSRPPRLNAHGYAVAERGQQLLEQLSTLIALARSPGEIGGKLMLGCVSGVSSDLIPRALANLRQSHPAVQVSMQEGLSEELATLVRRRELDAAIITDLPDPDPELNTLTITEEAMMVVAPRDCEINDWQQILASYPFIRLNRHAGMGKIIDRTLREHKISVHEAMELDSSEAVASMAIAGLGAGVIPEGRLRNVGAGEVTAIPFGSPAIFRKVVLVERRNNPRSDLSQLLYNEIKILTPVASNQDSP